MNSLSVGYAYDPRLHEQANAKGRDYWYAYVEELLSRLGVSAARVSLADAVDPAILSRFGVLILGDFPAHALPEGLAVALTAWVRAGGVLIGLGTEGMDTLFGVKSEGVVRQRGAPFSIVAYLELRSDGVATACRVPIEPRQRLLVIAPARVLRCEGSVEVARLFMPDPKCGDDGVMAHDSGRAAIVERSLGRGTAFYFGFSLPQTLWAIQQGRPVDRDYDGDGYLRVSDACVIGKNSRAVPYADCLQFLLGNMIGRTPVPMIHQVPPQQGRVAPALFYFGGDDECSPGNQVPASDFMAAQALPYHINAMPNAAGEFAITLAEQARIEAHGHEIALHYNFMDGFAHPCGFTREDVQRQTEQFHQRFGRDSVCSVMHWCRWTGWADPPRWIRECGGRADNSYIHWTSPPINPINRLGFAFGSAFPRHTWDDAAHGNRRLDFVELPIVAYEIGYEKETVFPETVAQAFNLAVAYRLTLNFFYHPVYIAQFPACRDAIRELVRLIRAAPVAPVVLGADAMALWWLARAAGRVRDSVRTANGLRFEVECAYGDGYVVKVPLGQAGVAECRVDGAPAAADVVAEFGQNWAFLALSTGRHAVELDLTEG